MKIHSGYYVYRHRNVGFKVIKCDGINAWYWQIRDQKVHDWHRTKKIAIEAAIDFINNDLKHK